jgi:hypothetical protein
MCAVSAVTDYYREKWPTLTLGELIPDTAAQTPWPYPPPQQVFLKPGVMVSAEQWAEYQELKRRMEEYDAQTGQPDCIKPEVAEWEQAVEAAVQQNNSTC